MYQVILFLHVLVCVAIIVLVLIQHGKGADIGATFGSGASNTVFGSQGSGSFLMKLTGFLAAAFFAICLILGSLATYSAKRKKMLLQVPKVNTSIKRDAENPLSKQTKSEDTSGQSSDVSKPAGQTPVQSSDSPKG